MADTSDVETWSDRSDTECAPYEESIVKESEYSPVAMAKEIKEKKILVNTSSQTGDQLTWRDFLKEGWRM